MNHRLQKAPAAFGGHARAFTLIELLVVMAVVGVLTATILPALSKAKQRGIQTRCMSNLKQVGIAIQLYVNDNDDALPGPIWSAARASYDRTSSRELIWFIADYLDSQSPATVPIEKPVIAEVFVCPGYRSSAPEVASMEGRKCYLLNPNVDPSPSSQVRPFGYPDPFVAPLKAAQLAS